MDLDIDSTQAMAGLLGLIAGLIAVAIAGRMQDGVFIKIIAFAVSAVVGYIVAYNIFNR